MDVRQILFGRHHSLEDPPELNKVDYQKKQHLDQKRTLEKEGLCFNENRRDVIRHFEKRCKCPFLCLSLEEPGVCIQSQ